MKQEKMVDFSTFLNKKGKKQKFTPKYTIYWSLDKKLRASVYLWAALTALWTPRLQEQKMKCRSGMAIHGELSDIEHATVASHKLGVEGQCTIAIFKNSSKFKKTVAGQCRVGGVRNRNIVYTKDTDCNRNCQHIHIMERLKRATTSCCVTGHTLHHADAMNSVVSPLYITSLMLGGCALTLIVLEALLRLQVAFMTLVMPQQADWTPHHLDSNMLGFEWLGVFEVGSRKVTQ